MADELAKAGAFGVKAKAAPSSDVKKVKRKSKRAQHPIQGAS
jgi:hypothetical protein